VAASRSGPGKIASSLIRRCTRGKRARPARKCAPTAPPTGNSPGGHSLCRARRPWAGRSGGRLRERPRRNARPPRARRREHAARVRQRVLAHQGDAGGQAALPRLRAGFDLGRGWVERTYYAGLDYSVGSVLHRVPGVGRRVMAGAERTGFRGRGGVRARQGLRAQPGLRRWAVDDVVCRWLEPGRLPRPGVLGERGRRDGMESPQRFARAEERSSTSAFGPSRAATRPCSRGSGSRRPTGRR
jgi:hypothetical protein